MKVTLCGHEPLSEGIDGQLMAHRPTSRADIALDITLEKTMTISADRKKPLWKFLLGGFSLSLLTLIVRDSSQTSLAGQIGGVFGGLFWGWLFWLLWARALKLAIGVALGLGILVSWAVLSSNRAPFDVATATAACSSKCQPQWVSQTSNPDSPAYKMTDSDVRGICDCYCDTGFKSLAPEQLDQLKLAKSASDISANQKIVLAFENSMKTCFPKFQKRAE
jgi:hypothetical protein